MSAGVPEVRYAIVDEEQTALYVVGVVDASEAEDGEDYCIIALPWCPGGHQGQWSGFEVRTLAGAKRLVRFTRMPVRKRNGLRRVPPTSWRGVYHQFAEGDQFRLEQLIEAYEGAPDPLGQSVVEDEVKDNDAEPHYVEQVMRVPPVAVLGSSNGGPPAGQPMVLGPRRDENPFALPLSGDETVLPGWVRAMGNQVAQLQVKQEEGEQRHGKQMEALQASLGQLVTGLLRLSGTPANPTLGAAAGSSANYTPMPTSADRHATLTDLGLEGLPTLSGRRPGRRSVSFHPDGPVEALGPPTGGSKMEEILAQLAASQAMQTRFLSSRYHGGGDLDPDDLMEDSLGPTGARSGHEREAFRTRMKEHPKKVVKELAADCEDGMPFSMKVFQGHATLHRLWDMLATEHALGQLDRALAQNVQNLKETATLAKYLKEKAAMEKLLSEAREASKKIGKDGKHEP
jgi:hypothetical protein